MYPMKLATLWAAATAMLFSGREAALLQAHHHAPPIGRGKSQRRVKPKSNRRQVVHSLAAHGRPIAYAQLSPKVDGVRMRWEYGRLIPRDLPSALPISKRTEERRRVARLRKKAALENDAPRTKRIPKGTWFRGDMKGAMRAARRAGIISARQQKRLHKQGRQP